MTLSHNPNEIFVWDADSDFERPIFFDSMNFTKDFEAVFFKNKYIFILPIQLVDDETDTDNDFLLRIFYMETFEWKFKIFTGYFSQRMPHGMYLYKESIVSNVLLAWNRYDLEAWNLNDFEGNPWDISYDIEKSRSWIIGDYNDNRFGFAGCFTNGMFMMTIDQNYIVRGSFGSSQDLSFYNFSNFPLNFERQYPIYTIVNYDNKYYMCLGRFLYIIDLSNSLTKRYEITGIISCHKLKIKMDKNEENLEGIVIMGMSRSNLQTFFDVQENSFTYSNLFEGKLSSGLAAIDEGLEHFADFGGAIFSKIDKTESSQNLMMTLAYHRMEHAILIHDHLTKSSPLYIFGISSKSNIMCLYDLEAVGFHNKLLQLPGSDPEELKEDNFFTLKEIYHLHGFLIGEGNDKKSYYFLSDDAFDDEDYHIYAKEIVLKESWEQEYHLLGSILIEKPGEEKTRLAIMQLNQNKTLLFYEANNINKKLDVTLWFQATPEPFMAKFVSEVTKNYFMICWIDDDKHQHIGTYGLVYNEEKYRFRLTKTELTSTWNKFIAKINMVVSTSTRDLVVFYNSTKFFVYEYMAPELNFDLSTASQTPGQSNQNILEELIFSDETKAEFVKFLVKDDNDKVYYGFGEVKDAVVFSPFSDAPFFDVMVLSLSSYDNMNFIGIMVRNAAPESTMKNFMVKGLVFPYLSVVFKLIHLGGWRFLIYSNSGYLAQFDLKKASWLTSQEDCQCTTTCLLGETIKNIYLNLTGQVDEIDRLTPCQGSTELDPEFIEDDWNGFSNLNRTDFNAYRNT